MSGFPHTLTEEELLSKIPEKSRKVISKVSESCTYFTSFQAICSSYSYAICALLHHCHFQFELNTEKSVAVMIIPKREDFETVLQESNITVEGKEPQLNAANIVWDLTDVC